MEKTRGYMVALSIAVPKLGVIEKFESPSLNVFGPVEFLFPPDKWLKIQRSSDDNSFSLEVFAKDEEQVEQAKRLLTRELNKVIHSWTVKLKNWGTRFENSLEEK